MQPDEEGNVIYVRKPCFMGPNLALLRLIKYRDEWLWDWAMRGNNYDSLPSIENVIARLDKFFPVEI